jgi:hypothetical protein
MLCLGVVLSWGSVSRHSSDKSSTTEPLFVMRIGLLLAPMLVGAPFFIQMAQVYILANGGSVSMGYDYLSMWLIGAGGTISIFMFGYRFYRQRLVAEPGFFSNGANAIGLMISAYLIFVVIDQYLFYVAHRVEAESVSWEFFKDKVTDIKCDSELLLVTDIDSKTLTYRCPSNFVMGRFSGAPFAPWPS